MTRARRLVVIVVIAGQNEAPYLAVRDWRRAPRHTALGGLPDGALRFGWGRAAGDQAQAETGTEAALELGTAVLSGLAPGRFSGPVPILTVMNRPTSGADRPDRPEEAVADWAG